MELFDFVSNDVEITLNTLNDQSLIADEKRLYKRLKERSEIINYPLNLSLFESYSRLPFYTNSEWSVKNDAVHFNIPLLKNEFELLQEVMISFKPWRKGPFAINSLLIDSEWQCQMKWDRLKKCIPTLENKRVLDLGCGNGYFMFRMLEHNPELVLGLDPTTPFYLQFQFFEKLTPLNQLHFLPFGWGELDAFESQFDVVFCMGVLYHHKDPVHLLKEIKTVLRPGGKVVLETIVYPTQEKFVFEPKGKYAGMRNIYKLPSPSQLIEWADCAGLKHDLSSDVLMTTIKEQRPTEWSTPVSLLQQLDKEDNLKTKEGHVAPHRIISVFRV
ncbi:tRNA 5-methoxyuridine(34)/uridine 5-oxyacetic acid(34) synthase CmoB [Candidatus Marinamargulisbacteria bacterium SCGC AAA071-K20]|nr:tRNA 5-methoxyuridine(34)/uridine 5-oxyacetic acid(34) synthase CmoB [Candidatus Marinamargulisbacteria bacterium SCGC AAA071-K20]